MSTFQKDVTTLMLRELRGFERELALFPTEADVWRTVPGLSNPAGNLALHVAGNLQQYVGAVLGRTGYVRNRGREFGERSVDRAQIGRELHAAMEAVTPTMAGLDDENLAGDYPAAAIDGMRIGTRVFLMHLCSHAAFHLAQAGYLRRVLTGDTGSSGPIPLGELAEPA